MSDEMDLKEIDTLLVNPHWSLDVDLVRHLYQPRAEVGRLRTLLATEQAKTNHARCWAAQWRYNAIGDLTSEPSDDPPAVASDGWTVRPPTEDEVNAYYQTHVLLLTEERLQERIEEQAYEDSK